MVIYQQSHMSHQPLALLVIDTRNTCFLLLQMTPLHNAARFANMGVVKYLVDHQADLNINNKFGVSIEIIKQ